MQNEDLHVALIRKMLLQPLSQHSLKICNTVAANAFLADLIILEDLLPVTVLSYL